MSLFNDLVDRIPFLKSFFGRGEGIPAQKQETGQGSKIGNHPEAASTLKNNKPPSVGPRRPDFSIPTSLPNPKETPVRGDLADSIGRVFPIWKAYAEKTYGPLPDYLSTSEYLVRTFGIESSFGFTTNSVGCRYIGDGQVSIQYAGGHLRAHFREILGTLDSLTPNIPALAHVKAGWQAEQQAARERLPKKTETVLRGAQALQAFKLTHSGKKYKKQVARLTSSLASAKAAVAELNNKLRQIYPEALKAAILNPNETLVRDHDVQVIITAEIGRILHTNFTRDPAFKAAFEQPTPVEQMATLYVGHNLPEAARVIVAHYNEPIPIIQAAETNPHLKGRMGRYAAGNPLVYTKGGWRYPSEVPKSLVAYTDPYVSKFGRRAGVPDPAIREAETRFVETKARFTEQQDVNNQVSEANERDNAAALPGEAEIRLTNSSSSSSIGTQKVSYDEGGGGASRQPRRNVAALRQQAGGGSKTSDRAWRPRKSPNRQASTAAESSAPRPG